MINVTKSIAVLSAALVKVAGGSSIRVCREEIQDNLQCFVHVEGDFETGNYRVTVQRENLYRDARPRAGTDISSASNIAWETDVHSHTYIGEDYRRG